MPATDRRNYDVIISGAGPVGLFLACELGLSGCSILVLERAPAAPSPFKMLPFGLRGLAKPTIVMLDRRDLLAPLKAREAHNRVGLPAHWSDQRRRPAGHFAGLQFFSDRVDPTAWPWRDGEEPATLAATMADIETVFAERAAALGVTIIRGYAVETVDQRTDRVVVLAGGEPFEAQWLIGCDGARSHVRKAAGIGFYGTEPEFTGYSALLRLAEPHSLAPGRHHTATGMYTFTPPGTITMAEYDGGYHHRADLSRDHVESVLRRVSGLDVRVDALELAATWTDRAFLAAAYRKGRVLLAGDSAHIHAPLGGQGLNLGLGDAVNLGWKLAATVRGDAPDGLLATYERERRPVAERVLDWSRAQVALMRPDPGAAALRDVLRGVMETRDGSTFFAGRVSGADLRHDLGGCHDLIGRNVPDLALADGSRLAEHMRAGRSVLLDLSSGGPLRSLADRWSRRLDYVAISGRTDIDLNAMLVRPDGLVAWVSRAGVDPDLAAAALARWVGEEDEIV